MRDKPGPRLPLSVTLIILVASSLIAQHKSGKPLAGYSAVAIEAFTIGPGQATKDFPAGEEAGLQRDIVAKLQTAKLFDDVGAAKETASGDSPSQPQAANRLILSGTVIRYEKGNSAVRFATWPLPAGRSKITVQFVFRSAASGQEVFRTDRDGDFQATLNGGIATKQQQVAAVKNSVVDALIKEIKKNR